MECKKCGTVNGDDFKFCKSCGAPLGEAETFCAGCGKKIEPDTAFCPYCGKAVLSEQKPVVTQTEESKEAYGDFYSVAAQMKKDKKPLVIGQKGKFIATMVKAWVLAGLFFLMFGLSFLSFMAVDISEETGVEEPVKVSAVQVLEASFGKKESMEDLVKDLMKKLSTAKDEKSAIRALSRFNVLRILCCKEVMEAAPFSTNFNLIMFSVIVLALMLGSLTFAILFLVEALFLTVKGGSALKKDIGGLSLGIMTAIALFALSTTVGGVGGGPLSAMIIGFSALALNSIFNAVILGRRPVSTKKLVTQCISLALGITLLFTMTAGHYGIKVEVEKTTVTDKTFIKVEKKLIDGDELVAGIDLFAADEDSLVYIGDVPVEDIDEDLVSRVYRYGADEMTSVAPPTLFFYAEMSEGYNAAGLVLGILSFVGYLLMGISLSVLLAFIMISLSDFKQRTSFTSHLLALIGSVILLVTSVVCVGVSSGIVSSLALSFKVFICAAPIINTVLAIGLFIQNAILGRREKTPAKN